MTAHKAHFAQVRDPIDTLEEVVAIVKPTCIIGKDSPPWRPSCKIVKRKVKGSRVVRFYVTYSIKGL